MLRHERLQREGQRRAAEKIAACFFKGASNSFMDHFLPALTEAYARYRASRLAAARRQRLRAALMYPSLYLTQPAMAMMLLGAQDPYADLSGGYPGQ